MHRLLGHMVNSGEFKTVCISIKLLQFYPQLSSAMSSCLSHCPSKKKFITLNALWMYTAADEVCITHEWHLDRSWFSLLDELITSQSHWGWQKKKKNRKKRWAPRLHYQNFLCSECICPAQSGSTKSDLTQGSSRQQHCVSNFSNA